MTVPAVLAGDRTLVARVETVVPGAEWKYRDTGELDLPKASALTNCKGCAVPVGGRFFSPDTTAARQLARLRT